MRETLDRMSGAGVDPNQRTYANVIGIMCDLGRRDDAVASLVEMQAQGMTPTARAMKVRARVFEANGKAGWVGVSLG